ncbi:hypothetical protein LCC91_10380 [Tepidimonas taiwanensis]|uniref:Type II secretion system protein GspC N-terminal domain-containing protein n=1 Tax=Tepidimonas taiwanensis TaxID=307486 RepID=A0A554XE00_9BURK|nr:hypothetical protein [Tepidimonas taiwanensis]TSE34068.1 hypothetical protein Ttaiw_00128 [Tepidimonas taiwanensis]UBQ04956.1 hypothetical protein LCC91_10380 [Tepidimonas taiwanensis]
MIRWLPLTSARIAGVLLFAAALATALQWLRPTGYESAPPDAWLTWAQSADPWAILRDPRSAIRPYQPRWLPPSPILPAIPDAPAPWTTTTVGTAAMLERPLFVPNRRPPPPPPPPEAAAPPDPLQGAVLVGTMAGERPIAIVRLGDGTRRLAVGADVGGWTLNAVEPTQATFARGDETRTLALTAAPLGAPNPQAQAAAPTGAAAAPAGATQNLPPNLQEVLERTRREMEARARARAAAGLPPLR